MPLIVRYVPLTFDETMEIASQLRATAEEIQRLQNELLIGDKEEIGTTFPGGFLTLRRRTPQGKERV